MLNIKMYLDPQEFRRYSVALIKLLKTADQLEDELPRSQAMDYGILLQNNILNQKYTSGFPQYSERYAEWKEQYGQYQGFWQLYGHLVNSITFWKVQKGSWKSGIPEGVMDSGGTSWLGHGDRGAAKPIAMYARTMEFGEGHNKKRPMFVPTKEEYKGRGFIRHGERALKKLAGQWS